MFMAIEIHSLSSVIALTAFCNLQAFTSFQSNRLFACCEYRVQGDLDKHKLLLTRSLMVVSSAFSFIS